MIVPSSRASRVTFKGNNLIFQWVMRLVRSEGGRIFCDFKSLSKQSGEKGSYQTQR